MVRHRPLQIGQTVGPHGRIDLRFPPGNLILEPAGPTGMTKRVVFTTPTRGYFAYPHPPALPHCRHFLQPAPDCTYRDDPQSGHLSPVIWTPSNAWGFSAISRVTSAVSDSVRWAAGGMFRLDVSPSSWNWSRRAIRLGMEVQVLIFG